MIVSCLVVHVTDAINPYINVLSWVCFGIIYLYTFCWLVF